jgi:U32 family peptidase
MKIIAPISSIKELDMLSSLGADELYCGFNTEIWQKNFDKSRINWINRREPGSASINSKKEFYDIVNIAHKNNISVALTLNAPFYTEKGISYLLALVEKLIKEIHIDALIVSDLHLIFSLHEEKFPVKLHLSSLGSCFNSQTAAFYGELGIKRIILPRQLTFTEIKELIENADSEMEFEVFAVNDGCYYEEGYCQTSHSFTPFCISNYLIKDSGFAEKKTTKIECEKLQKEFQSYLWYQNNCGSSYQEDGLPNGPCSLCLFGNFRDIGVSALKIVGREASFYRKMASLKMVKEVTDKAKEGAGYQEIAEFAKKMRNTENYCQSGYMCYFAE